MLLASEPKPTAFTASLCLDFSGAPSALCAATGQRRLCLEHVFRVRHQSFQRPPCGPGTEACKQTREPGRRKERGFFFPPTSTSLNTFLTVSLIIFLYQVCPNISQRIRKEIFTDSFLMGRGKSKRSCTNEQN